MIPRGKFPSCARAFFFVAFAHLLLVRPAAAIILYRTGDPKANTTAPTGDLANSGWQYQGTFGNFLGTPIAPHYFITAQHIGGAPKFVFRGANYTLVRSFDDPGSDLRIWQVAETFPAYAPLYHGSDEMGQRIAVFGRGTRRGAARIVGGQQRGWEWGTSDFVQRWGENEVASITQRATGGQLLRALFDQTGRPQEAHFSAGDSGGGVFVNDGGVWKLAGINFDVDSFASGPDRGGPYNAALYDERGSYTADGSLVSGSAPVPSGFYASRISSSFAWISGVLASHLANISTRAVVGEGDQVCIAGFILTGDSGRTKRLILRGLGPSLGSSGIPAGELISDPVIGLYDAGGLPISVNDDWRNSQASEIQASGLAPSDDREAAILATLAPGRYTAILQGANNTGGTGLIEVYDLDSESDSRLLNLSTRASVGVDNRVLIGGVIVRTISSRLLLRALGPELAAAGVRDVLADPILELYDANGSLLSANDDWRSAPNANDIVATGLAPTADHAAAILLPAPGVNSYTAIVRGVGNATGVALFEAYLIN